MKAPFCGNCPNGTNEKSCKRYGEECFYCYWNKDYDGEFDHRFDDYDVLDKAMHIMGGAKKNNDERK